MRPLLVALALVIGPASLTADERSRTARDHRHPGPQPSVTIRDLRPPVMKAGEPRGRLARMREQKRQLLVRIRAVRKQIATLQNQLAKERDGAKLRMLEARIEAGRSEIVRLRLALDQLNKRARRFPW